MEEDPSSSMLGNESVLPCPSFPATRVPTPYDGQLLHEDEEEEEVEEEEEGEGFDEDPVAATAEDDDHRGMTHSRSRTGAKGPHKRKMEPASPRSQLLRAFAAHGDVLSADAFQDLLHKFVSQEAADPITRAVTDGEGRVHLHNLRPFLGLSNESEEKEEEEDDDDVTEYDHLQHGALENGGGRPEERDDHGGDHDEDGIEVYQERTVTNSNNGNMIYATGRDKEEEEEDEGTLEQEMREEQLRQQYNNLLPDLRRYKETSEKLALQKDKLELKLARLRSAHNKKLLALQSDNSSLKSRNNELETMLKNSADDVAALNNLVQKQKKTISLMERQLKEFSEIKDKAINRESEVQRLQGEIYKHKEELTRVKKFTKTLQESFNEAVAELEELRLESKSKEQEWLQECETLRKALAQAHELASTQASEADEMNSRELPSLSDELIDFTPPSVSMLGRADESRETGRHEANHSLSSTSDSPSRAGGGGGGAAAAAAADENSNSLVATLEAALVEENKRLQFLLSESETQREELERLRRQCADQESEFRTLQGALDSVKAELASATAQTNELSVRHHEDQERWSKETDQLRQELSDSERQCKDLALVSSSLRDELSEMRSFSEAQIQDLTLNLRATEAKLERARTQLQEAQQFISQQHQHPQDNDNVDMTDTSLSDQLLAKTQEVDRLQQMVGHLERECDSLQRLCKTLLAAAQLRPVVADEGNKPQRERDGGQWLRFGKGGARRENQRMHRHSSTTTLTTMGLAFVSLISFVVIYLVLRYSVRSDWALPPT